jgi:nucleoside-diphosphate-sugar epimerase
MIDTYIIGKRSFLSKSLKKKIIKSKVISVKEFFNSRFSKSKKINIIYNYSYPQSKLNHSREYSQIVSKNILILNNFIDFILKKKIKINNFIFSSSASIYNLNLEDKIISQNDNNKTLYGASKFLMEKLLVSQAKNLKCNLIISRIFNMYGSGEENSLISKIIHRKKKKKTFINYTNQNSFRDFIYIDDLVNIYSKFLIIKTSGTYDTGSGRAINIRKLINKYFKKKNQINMKKKQFAEKQYSKANIAPLKKLIGNLSFLDVENYIRDNLD